MKNPPTIALLTDFGLQDTYVGVMKGAIASIAPRANIIDLTHDIPPQDLVAASFCLQNAYPFLPLQTIFVAVVDPGVGSARRAIALTLAKNLKGRFLVGPDNGLFSGLLQRHPPHAAVVLDNPIYWLTPNPSHTFHGRDIFAPVGAHLARGVPLKKLGSSIDPASLQTLAPPPCIAHENRIAGCIQYCDRFGNLVTNIPGSYVAGKRWSAVAAQTPIPACKTYSDAPLGEPLALVGSHGYIEIAVRGGSARDRLQVGVQAIARVEIH